MSIFTVYEPRGAVVLETDDWVDAEVRALVENWPSPKRPLDIRGTHPTHDWDDQRPRRCKACDGWDNGSYGSHLPCGYDDRGRALVTILRDELAAREPAATPDGQEG